MSRRKLTLVLCATAVFPAAQWVLAQGRGGEAPPAEGAAKGAKGRATAQRDLLYAAVPGRVDDIGFGGIGILVFDAARNFRFVKRIPTWDYPAAQSPENVKGVAVSAPLGMIWQPTRGRSNCRRKITSTDPGLWRCPPSRRLPPWAGHPAPRSSR